MSERAKKKLSIFIGKILLVTLLVVLLLRTFIVETFTLSSDQMETSLLKGDKILVDKTAYGIRMPITPLAIPFNFDKFMGRNSYSTLIELPYTRIAGKQVNKGDVILFNNPMERNKPLDRRSLFLSRCVAFVGDTIKVELGKYSVNGVGMEPHSDIIQKYSMKSLQLDTVKILAEDLKIPIREVKQNNKEMSISLSQYEAYLINQHFPDSMKLMADENLAENVKFVVPGKGMAIDIDTININIYGSLILDELGIRSRIDKNRLFYKGEEMKKYTFKEDYYWVMSDNQLAAIDSRSLGFIPFPNIIGRAKFIWLSYDGENIRKDRCLTSVK